MQQNFPWKRFWCPPDGKLGLDELGFLNNPEKKYFDYIESDVVPFEKIQHIPCLILLGEPGIGKSNAIKTENAVLTQKIDENKEGILYKDLKDYNSDDHLRKDIFESDKWKEFKEGNFNLYLFLDSLDEVRIRIHTVERLILNELKKAPINRLFLRIACRTFEWPLSFQEGLDQLWKKNNVKAYELTPLRSEDIKTASDIFGIDFNNFINAISEKDAGPLASKPVTLNFLLYLFKNDGQFPKSRFELYEKGCMLLCEEPDLARREKDSINKGYAGSLSPEQRLTTSSRIASVLAFCNQVSIQRDSLLSEAPEGTVKISELVVGKEKTASEFFNITEDAIKESLTTGLFTSRGENLFGFAHQTYQEFLAARYLKDTPFEQVKSLLFHPHNDHRIIPQLHETAAWLAGKRQDVFEWILKNEPEILLSSDLGILDDINKKSLVAALLDKFKSGENWDHWEFHKHYKKLSHPQIGKQLKPYIKENNLSFIVRRAAIHIAEACKTVELQKILVNIALDQKEPHNIRTQAGHAVVEIADSEIKENLEPLAKGEAGDDPDDGLRGIGMKCMWPNKWTVLNLFENITPRKKDHYYGSYAHFLKYEAPSSIANKILDDEIPKILSIIKEWKIIKSRDFDLSYLAEIYDDIFKLAWAKIPDQQVMENLSEIILSRIKDYRPVYGAKKPELWSQLATDIDKKHAITKFIIETNKIDKKNITILAFRETPLITDNDFLWLLEEIEKANPTHQILWADLIMWTLRYELPTDYMSKFLEVRERLPVLQEKYHTFWKIDSKLARDIKANHLRQQRWERANTPKSPNPPILKRIDGTLQDIERGNYDKWYDLVNYLSINQETGERQEWPSRLQDTPGWKTLVQSKRKQVIEAANHLLQNCDPLSNDLFGNGSWSWPEISIQSAILLVHDNKITDKIPNHVWEKLVPYMIDYAFACDRTQLYCVLFNLAYEKAPEETRRYFVKLLQIKNEKDGRIYFIDYIKDCWNDKLNPVLLEQLDSPEIKPESFEKIVEFLDNTKTPEIEESVTKNLFHNKNNNPELFPKVVELTLTYWGNKYWSQIIDIFNQHPEIAKKVIGNLAATNKHIVKCLNNLDEQKLAELYFLINEKYPVEADSPLEGGQWGSDLRTTIFNHLVNKGTQQACKAIKYLIEKIPNQNHWMRFRLNEAITNTLKKTWIPPTPVQIINMLQNKHKRYVENEEQLLSVVLESLQRMQEYLNGELTPTERFWNYEGSGNRRQNFRPKDEERLSDEIVQWLRDYLSPLKGIIINREVQPRRGQKTDIYVDAVKLNHKPDDAVQPLSIVIEVKGCWHDDVLSAMEHQLHKRYMKKNSISCGLYIVGWFMCNQWSNSDPRKKNTPEITIGELKEDLDNQAYKIKEKSLDIRDLQSFCLDVSLKPS